MKSKRVILESDCSASSTNGNSSCLNSTTDFMRKLRAKYVNCKEIRISESNEETDRANEEALVSHFYTYDENVNYANIPLMRTPVNVTKQKSVIENGQSYAVNKSVMQTNDETEHKDYRRKHGSSAKILTKEVNETLNTGNANKRNSCVTLLNFKFLKENVNKVQVKPTAEKEKEIENEIEKEIEKEITTVLKIKLDQNEYENEHGYFAEPQMKMSSFFPYDGDFPSQISFVDASEESQHLLSSGNAFSYSCSLGSSCKCTDCQFYPSDLEEDPKYLATPAIKCPALTYRLSLRSPNDYKDFGLIPNSDIIQSPSSQTHSLLPAHFKNDSSYKLKLFKYLKKPHHSDNKTDFHKFDGKRKFTEAFDGNLTKFYSQFDFKRRKVNSEKKLYESEHAFEDNRVNQGNEKMPPQYFKFYSDRSIGFNEKWQRQLKQAEMDDDVETDDDQLRAADRHIVRELGDGIKFYMKNKRNVRNAVLLKNN